MLDVKNLNIHFYLPHGGDFHAVKDVSFDIARGETVALVGESGSGKSVTALAVMQLLGANAVQDGSITFDGKELMHASSRVMQTIRGRRIGMIFQEPMTALNPLHTVEKQICEVLIWHQKFSKSKARARLNC